MANEVKIILDTKDQTANAFVTASGRVRTFKAETLRSLDELNAKKLRIDADIAGARQKIERLRSLAEKTTSEPQRIKYEADIAAAEAKIKVLQHRSNDLRRKITMTADVDERSVRRALDGIVGVVRRVDLGGKIGGIVKVGLVAAAGAGVTAISGAIIAGSILGVAGAAALLQKDNPSLKAAGKGLAENIIDGLREASAGLVDPLIDAVHLFRAQFNADLPVVKQAFDAVGESIRPLAAGIAGMVHQALPGFAAMLEAGKPVAEMLGRELPQLGVALGNVFRTIGGTAPYAAQALEDLLHLVEGTLDLFRALIVASVWVDQALHGNFLSMDQLREIYRGAESDINPASDALREMGSAAKTTTEAMNALASTMLDERAASRAFFEAVDAANDGLKKGRLAFDSGTEAGRRNQAMIDDVARSTLAWMAASEANGESQERSNSIMNVGLERLTAMHIKLGMTRTDAIAASRELLGLGRQAGLLPKKIGISVAMSGAQAVIGVLNGIQSRIGWINGHPAVVRVNTAAANVREDRYAVRYTGGIIGAAAGGGPRGALTMVGEQGRELVRLPTGSQVYSHPDSERMLSSGTAGPQRIQLEWVGNTAGDEFMAWLQKNIRIRGGLDAALGS